LWTIGPSSVRVKGQRKDCLIFPSSSDISLCLQGNLQVCTFSSLPDHLVGVDCKDP
jgi:hypothetical protein